MKGFEWLGKLLGGQGGSPQEDSPELPPEDNLTTEAGSTGAMARELDAEEDRDEWNNTF